ncbi:MAG: hypothetical protein K0R15_1712 [Clostridiales bacterium]|nr:hypothetical protein [Clostridiales bacterium]
MRIWFSGRILASQAEDAGSIPVIRLYEKDGYGTALGDITIFFVM